MPISPECTPTTHIKQDRPRDFSPTHHIWEHIIEKDLRLSPEALGAFFPHYRTFEPSGDQCFIRSHTSDTPLRHPVLLGIYAPTAAGKDSLIDGIDVPWLRITTTTTRPQRFDEFDIPGVTYHFTEENAFQEMVQRGEMLEWMREVSGLYGTTKREVQQKLQKAEKDHIPLIIWRGNIEGHTTFAPALQQTFGYPMRSLFILPNMTVRAYQNHIYTKRGKEEGLKRWTTALGEIEHAPKMVDAIIMNEFDKHHGLLNSVCALNNIIQTYIDTH